MKRTFWARYSYNEIEIDQSEVDAVIGCFDCEQDAIEYLLQTKTIGNTEDRITEKRYQDDEVVWGPNDDPRWEEMNKEVSQ